MCKFFFRIRIRNPELWSHSEGQLIMVLAGSGAHMDIFVAIANNTYMLSNTGRYETLKY